MLRLTQPLALYGAFGSRILKLVIAGHWNTRARKSFNPIALEIVTKESTLTMNHSQTLRIWVDLWDSTLLTSFHLYKNWNMLPAAHTKTNRYLIQYFGIILFRINYCVSLFSSTSFAKLTPNSNNWALYPDRSYGILQVMLCAHFRNSSPFHSRAGSPKVITFSF